MLQLLRSALVACALMLILPSLALAGVKPGQPFPTNLDTKIDLTQLTGLRVALPKPDCTTHPSDCADIDVLNTLDGFNVDARVSIPFSGPIDLTTVTHDTVFLVDAKGQRTPLDRLVWTPATNTLHGEPHTYLDQHTPYLLVVTDGVRAADGSALNPSAFRQSLDPGRSHDLGEKLYDLELLDALHWAHVPPGHVVDASLFTTQSITSLLEKVRGQIDRSQPGAGELHHRLGRRADRVPLRERDRRALPPPGRDVDVQRLGAAGRGRRLPRRDRHRRLRQLLVAGLRELVAGDSAGRHRARSSATAEHEHAVLQSLAAVRARAGRRLARRDRRTRLHRLEAGLPDHDRVDDGQERHRHDRDQRRRPRRRPARNAHGAQDGRNERHVLRGRARVRPGRQRHDRLDRGRQRRRRRSPPSATATGCARP